MGAGLPGGELVALLLEQEMGLPRVGGSEGRQQRAKGVVGCNVHLLLTWGFPSVHRRKCLRCPLGAHTCVYTSVHVIMYVSIH